MNQNSTFLFHFILKGFTKKSQFCWIRHGLKKAVFFFFLFGVLFGQLPGVDRNVVISPVNRSGHR